MQSSFQFQYGSIKILYPNAIAVFSDTFQFQYGSIKITDYTFNPSKESVFQFQYGSIKIEKLKDFKTTAIFVSIPIRFN